MLLLDHARTSTSFVSLVSLVSQSVCQSAPRSFFVFVFEFYFFSSFSLILLLFIYCMSVCFSKH